MLRKIGFCVVCILMLSSVTCKAGWLGLGSESEEYKKEKEAAILEAKKNITPAVFHGDNIYTKCILGYMCIIKSNGNISQMYTESPGYNPPQPMKCNE